MAAAAEYVDEPVCRMPAGVKAHVNDHAVLAEAFRKHRVGERVRRVVTHRVYREVAEVALFAHVLAYLHDLCSAKELARLREVHPLDFAREGIRLAIAFYRERELVRQGNCHRLSVVHPRENILAVHRKDYVARQEPLAPAVCRRIAYNVLDAPPFALPVGIEAGAEMRGDRLPVA